jgi:3-hydroxybutyryl-CoA dehydrogenase
MQVSEIKRIGLVGAGLMGHGIGQEFAVAGYDVVFHDASPQTLETVKERIRCNLLELVEWDLAEEEQVDSTLARIETAQDLEETGAEADLVIEAVFEDLSLKQEVFTELDRVCPERTILASNTSSLMPSMLASATSRPDRVLVTHYFYPPPLIPLVEVVRSEFTSDEVVNTACDLLKAIGKKPIIVRKEALGFIVNRLQMALDREALSLVERGIATAQDVDMAVWNSFGRRLAVVGPLQLFEFQDGWEVALQIYNYITPDIESSKDPPQVMLDLVEREDLGPKTGKGFYQWNPQLEEAFSKNLKEALAGFLRADRERGA